MLENGTVIDGKYEILSKVGQGGMSVVYLALNRKAMKQWAIKEVRRDGVKDFEVVKQSLVAETDMLKKLSHPNLPDIVDIIENDDSFFIVMDYIEGKPLSKRIEETGAQPEEFVVEWAKQLCDVLDYLHTRQPAIIYRDMKPSNVMLKPDGSVCLIDFGTAREYKGTNIQDTTCLGTIGYAAPEQFGGQGETDARTDIYCLGATLYHLVTGHSPAEPPYEMHPIRYWDDRLSPGLEAIILKCIQKNPADRYQSCAELKYALENMEENTRAYWVKQKKRVNIFLTCVISMLVCFAIGLTGTIMGNASKKSQFEFYSNKASKEAGAAAVEDYRKAFEQDYMGVSAEELTQSFVKYTEALVNNDDTHTITEEEKDALESALGIADKSNENKFVDIIKRDSDQYVILNYEIGIQLLQFYEGTSETSKHNEAKKWFVNANDEGINKDRLSVQEAITDYELAEALNAMIDGWNEIQSANDGDGIIGKTVDYNKGYQTIENAVNTVLGTALDNGVKLKVFEVMANFLEDSDNVNKFRSNGGNVNSATDKWSEIRNELENMSNLNSYQDQLKTNLLDKDAAIRANLAAE
ncbi:MAG: serine/threonine protein kinase [Eubacterium sp.]|nr:serine/threonine protein kinase [Eubacterium sp.]